MMIMMTVVVSYERISPMVLSSIVRDTYPDVECRYTDMNEDYFSFSVYYDSEPKGLKEKLAEYE